MPLYIKDDHIDKLADQLKAALKVPTKTEAVRLAITRELDRIEKAVPLRDRVKTIQDNLGIEGRTASFDHKAFTDSLYE